MNGYLKKFIAVIAGLCILLECSAAFAEYKEVSEEVYAGISQNFTTLDISAAANMGFADDVENDGKGGWTDQGPTNDLSCFDLKGENTLLGIKFNFIVPSENGGKSCIVLRGQNNEAFPTSAQIPVNAKGAGIYFLHTSAWPKGEVGRYRIVYEDGTEYVKPVVYNQDIFNWWATSSTNTSKLAWTGSNDSTSTIGLNVYALDNPYPEKTIEKVVAETDGDVSYMMILAATLTDSGPYLPINKDIGNPDTTNWYPYTPNDSASIKDTALDMSFLLDAPAGKHGYINADGEDLYFDDGTEARFWCVNVTHNYAAPIKEDADELADRIAQSGFNLVRFHSFDWTKYGEGKGGIWKSDSSEDFDERFMNNFCYLLSKLKEKGIYYMIDLNVNRPAFAKDNIADYKSVKVGLREIAFFDERAIELQLNYAEKLLGWYNPYTGMTIGTDPSLVFVDYNNESSITAGRYELSEHYYRIFKEKFAEYLKEKYQNDISLASAWAENGKTGLQEGESLENNSVEIPIATSRSKFSRRRQADSYEFCYLIQKDYFDRMTEKIRSLGVKALLTGCTYWTWSGSVGALATGASVSDMDFVDAHSYYCHPSGGTNLAPPVRIGGSIYSMIEQSNMGLFGSLMNMKVYGAPFTVTEWNSLEPNQYTSEAFLLMASYASLQNWHPMLYSWGPVNYSYRRKLTTERGNYFYANEIFSANQHPDQVASFYPAAMIYLRGDVKEAEHGFYNRFRGEQVFLQSNQTTSTSPYTGMIGKSGIALDSRIYSPDYNSNDILKRSYLSQKNNMPFVSETGELSLDQENCIFKLNTSKTQAVTGQLKDICVCLDDVNITMYNDHGTIYLSSLSDEPIWKAERLLLTTVGRKWNSGQVISTDGRNFEKAGEAPVLIEPIEGEIVLKTGDDVTVYALTSSGERKERVTVTKDERGFSKFNMSSDYQTMHYEILKEENLSFSRKPNEKVVFEVPENVDLFSDLDNCQWAKYEIERMVMTDTISGITENEFSPDSFITRRDFVRMVVNSLGLSGNLDNTFDDVNEKDSAFKEITIAKGLGVVTGDENNCFNPDSPLTRQDMAVIAMRALEKAYVINYNDFENEDNLGEFYDCNDVADYARVSLQTAKKYGYISGDGNRLNPAEYATRAQATVFAYNIVWN